MYVTELQFTKHVLLTALQMVYLPPTTHTKKKDKDTGNSTGPPCLRSAAAFGLFLSDVLGLICLTGQGPV